jgi:hypothetical protein
MPPLPKKIKTCPAPITTPQKRVDAAALLQQRVMADERRRQQESELLMASPCVLRASQPISPCHGYQTTTVAGKRPASLMTGSDTSLLLTPVANHQSSALGRRFSTTSDALDLSAATAESSLLLNTPPESPSQSPTDPSRKQFNADLNAAVLRFFRAEDTVTQAQFEVFCEVHKDLIAVRLLLVKYCMPSAINDVLFGFADRAMRQHLRPKNRSLSLPVAKGIRE